MKGQMVLEFIISAVMFFAVILFTINYLNNEVSVFSSDYFTNEVESKAVQVSELLLHSPGVWKSDGSAEAIGLSDEWPVLNMTKVDYMEQYYCSSDNRYNELLEMLDMKIKLLYGGEWINRWLRLYIRIVALDGEELLLECPANGYEPESGTVATMRRFAVLEDGRRVSLTVSAWF